MSGAGPACAALLVLALALVATLRSLTTPRPRGRGDFALDRALAHVAVIAARPHPAGSEPNAAVAEYLLAQLAELGMSPRLDRGTALRVPRTGLPVLARVANISASAPGNPALGSVVLMAHYDSVATAPGAADDAAGVATVLEVARALLADPAPRGSVHVLLTDGEEIGLLGARAAVARWSAPAGPRLDPNATVVLNFEARGVSGPAIMFETSSAGRTVRLLAGARRPIATSVAAEVYRRLPNNTDFTEVTEAGYDGLNFALIRGSAYYHTAGDEPARLSPASLSHLGELALHAGRRALSEPAGTQGGEPAGTQDGEPAGTQGGTPAGTQGGIPAGSSAASGAGPIGAGTVHFPVLGRLVRYPGWLSAISVAVAAGTYSAAAVVAARAGLSLPRTGLAAAGVLGLIAMAALLGIGFWRLAVGVRPELASFEFGDSYRSGWFGAGMLALVGGLVLLAGIGLRSLAGRAGLLLACGAVLVLLALLCAVLAPGAAYLFGWPPLLASLVLLAGVRGGRIADGAWLPAGFAAALAAALLFVPIVVLLLPTNGLAGLPAPLALLVLPLLAGYQTALPVLTGGATTIGAGILLVAGIALLTTGFALDRIDGEHPQHTGLCYLSDDQARWLSGDRRPPAWTRQFVGTERVPIAESGWLGPVGLPRTVLVAAAPSVPVAEPRWHCREEPDGPGRQLLLRLVPGVPGGALWLRWKGIPAEEGRESSVAAGRLLELVVDGVAVPCEARPAGFGFWAVPADGIEVRLRLADRRPLELELAAHSDGLPAELVGPELPPELTWGATYTRVTVRHRRLVV